MPEENVGQSQGAPSQPAAGSPAGTPAADANAGQPQPGQQATSPSPAGQPAQGQPAQGQQQISEQAGNRQLRERFERELATRNETIQQIQREVAQYKRQVAALMGVTPQSQGGGLETDEVRELREQIETLYPALKRFREEGNDIFQLLDTLKENYPNLESFQQQHWNTLGHDTMNRVIDSYREAYNVTGELSPSARRQLHSAFVAFVQQDEAFTDRYINRDPKLVAEFIDDLKAGLLSQPRVQANAGVINRGTQARLPRGGVTSSPVAGQQPAKPKDIDEALNAFDALVQG